MLLILEGLPASGKTTLANFLRDKYGFQKVNESLGQLSDVNLSNDQRTIFRETLEKYEFAKDSKKLVIIDRGYPSMLAWDYCAEKLQISSHLKEKMEWVETALRQNKLFEPDLYLYLTITPMQSLSRRPRKEIVEDVWSGKMGMNYCSEYYDFFFQKYSVSNKLLKINGIQSIQDIALQIVTKTNCL